jgi:hypothetical protein
MAETPDRSLKNARNWEKRTLYFNKLTKDLAHIDPYLRPLPPSWDENYSHGRVACNPEAVLERST